MKQQERQNEIIGRQSERVVAQSEKLAQAAEAMVAKDAEARREIIETQRELNGDLQRERANIDQQKGAIDEERRQLAAERVRTPLFAETVRAIGILFAGLVPLVLVGYLLRVMSQEERDDRAVAELLITAWAKEPDRLPTLPFGTPRAIEHQRGDAEHEAVGASGEEQ